MTDTIVSVIRKGGCARVTLESGKILRIPHALYIMRKLYPGRQLDTKAYNAWRRTVEYRPALDRAVKYLEGRERSRGEVIKCLQTCGYEQEAIDRVILTLEENRFLQDSRFAGLWVDARAQKLGRNRIRQELRMKGVDEETARQALNAFSEEDELEMATEQARKLLRRQDDERKLINALVRRGYSFSIAKKALQNAGKADIEAEWEE
ncbi:MAG: hypothetical protein CW338_11265 [Clostridiales bacterium]|nr:hypothetical protein [Clostridiales bacterium]